MCLHRKGVGRLCAAEAGGVKGGISSCKSTGTAALAPLDQSTNFFPVVVTVGYRVQVPKFSDKYNPPNIPVVEDPDGDFSVTVHLLRTLKI